MDGCSCWTCVFNKYKIEFGGTHCDLVAFNGGTCHLQNGCREAGILEKQVE